MTSKDKLKLGIAGLLLLVAVLIFLKLSSRNPIPDAEEARTLWYCTACRSAFELTGDQAAVAIRQRAVGPTAPPSEDEPQARRPGRTLVEVVTCPFCKELAGMPARRCPECGEVFAARAKDGEAAICPNCRWDPKQGRRLDEFRPAGGNP